MLKGSEVTEKGECQEARRARLQETAASDVPLGATVGDAVLLPWNSDHNFQHSLLGLLENSEMGAQGERWFIFHPSCHLCSHRWKRRDEDGEKEGTPATTRRWWGSGEVGPNRDPPPRPLKTK